MIKIFNFLKPYKDDLYNWKLKNLILMTFFAFIIGAGPILFFIIFIILTIDINIERWQDIISWTLLILAFLLFCLIPISWIFFTIIINKKSQKNLIKYKKTFYTISIITLNFLVLYFLIYINKTQKINIEKTHELKKLFKIEKTSENTFHDKWFFYKFFAAIVAWTSLLFAFLYHLLNKTYTRDIETPFEYGLFIEHFISFFTHQTNFLVALWFTLAIFFHKKQAHKKYWFLKFNTIINITTYISVTALTYLLFIYPLAFKNLTLPKHLIGLLLHLVVPSLMVFYTLNYIGKNYVKTKDYWTNKNIIMLIYPISYCVFTLVRFFIYYALNLNLELGFPYLPKNFFPPFPKNEIGNELAFAFFWSIILTYISLFMLINLILFINVRVLYNKINNKKFKTFWAETKMK